MNLQDNNTSATNKEIAMFASTILLTAHGAHAVGKLANVGPDDPKAEAILRISQTVIKAVLPALADQVISGLEATPDLGAASVLNEDEVRGVRIAAEAVRLLALHF